MSFLFQERQIQKGFNIAKSEGSNAKDVFAMAAMGLKKSLSRQSSAANKSNRSSFRASRRGKSMTKKEKFRSLALKAIKQEHEEESPIKRHDPIGSKETSIRRRNASLRRSLIARGNSMEETDYVCLTAMNSDELVVYNPKLSKYTPTTRMAYAKFKNALKNQDHKLVEEDENV